MPTRFRSLILLVAALATAVTVLSALPLDFAYRSPAGHVAIETAAALVGMLVSFLLLGRFIRSGRLGDLILAASLALLAFTNLFFAAVPASADAGAGPFATWAPLGGRLLGAIGFAASAFVGDRRVRRTRRAAYRAGAGAVLVLAGLGALFGIFGSDLPRGIDPATSPDSGDRGWDSGHPAVATVQLIGTLLYAAAAVGFARAWERTHDHIASWIAVACTLSAFANLNYFLFPSLYSEWVYTGDFLRLLFYLVLLGGAASQIVRYQRGLAETAALEERRRLARELHDGLAQELAYIATQTRWLSKRVEQKQVMDQLAMAAERALDESRSAISALTRPMDEPLDTAVAQAAEEVAGRRGVRLRLDLEPGISVPASTRESLLRIVREAVSNTARHGQASCVTVRLKDDGGLTLRVEDDGVGFDPANPEKRDGGGFGLTSMKERTAALGGQMRVSSRPGEGTEIEVVLP